MNILNNWAPSPKKGPGWSNSIISEYPFEGILLAFSKLLPILATTLEIAQFD